MLFVYTLWIIKSQPSCFLGIAPGLATSLSTATLSPVPHQQCPFINPVASCMLPIINYDVPQHCSSHKKCPLLNHAEKQKGQIQRVYCMNFIKFIFISLKKASHIMDYYALKVLHILLAWDCQQRFKKIV